MARGWIMFGVYLGWIMFGVYLGWMMFGAFGGLLGAWYIHHVKYMERL